MSRLHLESHSGSSSAAVSMLLAAVVTVSVSGCAGVAGPEITGYACCNLRYETTPQKAFNARNQTYRFWISDANYTSLPMIPAGSPIRTKKYWAYSVSVDVDAIYRQEMFLGLDFGREQNFHEWVRQMIVKESPRERMSHWPESVRQVVIAGKVAVGMTREQLIVSIGYPPAHGTPSLEARRWKYWYGNFDVFFVTWDDEGRVQEVDGDEHVRAAVVF